MQSTVTLLVYGHLSNHEMSGLGDKFVEEQGDAYMREEQLEATEGIEGEYTYLQEEKLPIE